MSREVEAFIQETTEQVRPLYVAYTRAMWEAATHASQETQERAREAKAALMRFWADRERFERARALRQRGVEDPLLARALEALYLAAAKAQQDEATLEAVTRLEAEVQHIYTAFRAEVNGRRLSDNDLEEILRQSTDDGEVRAAWEASKQVGAQVADKIRELARLRNAAARAQGFRDHFQRMLTLDEIDENELFDLFDRLERATREPFARLKARIDELRARRFGIEVADLRPWHYGDRFFQTAPPLSEVDLDALFADKDLVALARATYDGLGLEVEDILARSDLYEREGKNQHAFCLDVDREGDIRTLNNLRPDHRWMTTLLHELGHAVYDKYIDPDLPWLLRTPAHTLSTEAIAILMGDLASEADWLRQVAGAPAAEADRLARAAAEKARASRLVFTRWVLVMTHFERALYEDPERDLNTLWWDLVERYQRLRRPEGRDAPDWAAKYHVALAPVYYHNYELGHLVRAQLRRRLDGEAGGLVGRPEVGAWLVERWFRHGKRYHWADLVQRATSERLSPEAFVAEMSDSET